MDGHRRQVHEWAIDDVQRRTGTNRRRESTMLVDALAVMATTYVSFMLGYGLGALIVAILEYNEGRR